MRIYTHHLGIDISKETFNVVNNKGKHTYNTIYVKGIEVTGSTLLIVNHKIKKETISDFTDEKFQYALPIPKKLKDILSVKINEYNR